MTKLVDLELNLQHSGINNDLGIKMTECVGSNLINLTSLTLDLKYN